MEPASVGEPALPRWPVVGVVADEPWPEQPPTLAVQEPVPLFAQASMTRSAEALDEFSAVVDQSANAQLQKALRRARIEAVKTARARKAARESDEKAARKTTPSSPMPVVHAASAGDAPADERSTSLPSLSSSLSRPSAVPVAAAHASSAPAPLANPPPRASKARNRAIAIGAAIVLAVLLLVIQVLRHQRDAIVAQQPSWRPAMETLCKFTGCEIAALRRIGDITIDGAAFAREKSGEGYRLDFTLRNGLSIPLAMPAVELTLLDTQERAVVRRVLMPADFGAPAVLAARAERNVSLPLALSGTEAAALPPVAGYRVVAFYP